MQSDPQPIGFVPVGPEHYALLQAWLDLPHMREWWGDTEDELGVIRDMVEGRDTTRPFLIAIDGTPVGYIQVWFVGHHQNETWIADHPWLASLPSDAVGVDISIGVPERLSKGVGSAALAAFVRRLRDEGHETIIIDPLIRNERAVRAYTKVGFRPIPHLLGRTGDTLIMQFDPENEEK
jgi:aminoglycoside 6'-N-acetyltransferase